MSFIIRGDPGTTASAVSYSKSFSSVSIVSSPFPAACVFISLNNFILSMWIAVYVQLLVVSLTFFSFLVKLTRWCVTIVHELSLVSSLHSQTSQTRWSECSRPTSRAATSSSVRTLRPRMWSHTPSMSLGWWRHRRTTPCVRCRSVRRESSNSGASPTSSPNWPIAFSSTAGEKLRLKPRENPTWERFCKPGSDDVSCSGKHVDGEKEAFRAPHSVGVYTKGVLRLFLPQIIFGLVEIPGGKNTAQYFVQLLWVLLLS